MYTNQGLFLGLQNSTGMSTYLLQVKRQEYLTIFSSQLLIIHSEPLKGTRLGRFQILA
jgi:hypothetical protein